MAPDAIQIERWLVTLGLPRPRRAEREPGTEHTLRLHLDGGPVVRVGGPPRTPFRSARHAATALRMVGSRLPVTPRWEVVDGRTLVEVASPGHAGRAGGPLVDQVRRELGAIAAPHFGHAPDDGGFLPVAGSWSEEVSLRARVCADRARASRAPEDLIDELVDVVAGRVEALDRCQDFTLVHGNLTPLSVIVDDDGALTEVSRWHRAHFGDPVEDLAKWVVGARQPIPAVAELDTDQRLRLEAYIAVALLELLELRGRPSQVALRLLSVRDRLRALRDGWVDQLAQGASAAGTSVGAFGLSAATLVTALPGLPTRQADLAFGGLGAAALAVDARERGDDELAELLERAVARAAAAVDSHGTPWNAAPVLESTPDARTCWLTDRISRSVPAMRELGTTIASRVSTRTHEAAWARTLTDRPLTEQRCLKLLRKTVQLAADPDDDTLANVRGLAEQLGLRSLLSSGYSSEIVPSVRQLLEWPEPTPEQWFLFAFFQALGEVQDQHDPFMPAEAALAWMRT